MKDKTVQHDNDVIITITNPSNEIAAQADALRSQAERLLMKSQVDWKLAMDEMRNIKEDAIDEIRDSGAK